MQISNLSTLSVSLEITIKSKDNGCVYYPINNPSTIAFNDR